MREHYERQIAIIEDRIALMEAGRFTTRSMTAEHPVWVDTTAGNLAHDRQTVEMLKGVIARFYPDEE
ncbi:hypothetical protein GGQ99_001306 [Aminobacter niigataensis]|uniref:Uncharacterized protein n=1 Tax=Aminobacter niigataensis TaxID=83265 RepID=A0ABR6KYI3_9HYPH|nr:hypothetical protein [Aminobacter niigataensis]MBB4649584.1 hypothetical protein [Aminobacter niigataensis]